MEIKLDKKHTLKSDTYNIWIESVVTRKRKTTDAEYEDMEIVCGYHQDLNALFDSFERRKIRMSSAKDLLELRKVIEDVASQRRVFEKAVSKAIMKG